MTTPKTAGAQRALRLDPFIIALVLAAACGFLIPATGVADLAVTWLTKAAIALLFFMQGVRLERAAVIQGLTHWRLQLLTLASTFVLFPILGLALHRAIPGALDDSLWLGVLYLCTLPSTVQSSIAFTSIARGNVAAAITAATASNLLGILVTPLLVTALLGLHGESASALDQIRSISIQLLAPFIAGQIAGRWLRLWAMRNARLLAFSDRGSILLVVYSAFSEAVLAGAWNGLHWPQLLTILGLSVFLLAIVLTVTRQVSGLMHFSTPDRIAIIFCGSKKSLATGVPMANVLFPTASVGVIILPVMIFHQLQLLVCAYLARRYADKAAAHPPEPEPRAHEP